MLTICEHDVISDQLHNFKKTARTRKCEQFLPEADRAGFEPAVGFAPYAGLANRYLQPLGHLSKVEKCTAREAIETSPAGLKAV